MDKRGASVDAKIKQLDAELARHREILRTCRTPAAKEAAKRRALQVLKQRRLYEGQREQLRAKESEQESCPPYIHTLRAGGHVERQGA